MKTTELLFDFVNQSPKLNKLDFETSKQYNDSARELTKQRTDFLELLVFSLMRIEDFERKLNFNLRHSQGFLRLGDGCLNYSGVHARYRSVACNAVAQLILNHYRDEYPDNGPDELREKITSRLSNRVSKLYFN